MHHLAPEEAAAHLADRAQPRTGRQQPLLRRVEVQQAQQQLAAVVAQVGDELAARAQLDARVAHHALDLRGLAFVQLGDARDPGVVLPAQRQVQREVDVAREAELLERALWP